MHNQAINFLNQVKSKMPEAFNGVKALDIGSFNVNGSVKDFFKDSTVLGLDLMPGLDVDIVCPANEYNAPNESFDTIISCECWEHNPFYEETILNSIRMLKPKGYFIWTCASTGRPIHGTATQDLIDRKKGQTLQGNKINHWITMPNVKKQNWDNNYYKNITIKDCISLFDYDRVFSKYSFEFDSDHCDLYFWGIKN